jgi:caffeoyl-CoA O-methyltransferase
MLTLVDHKIEEYAINKTEPTSKLLQELVSETHEKTTLPQMLTGPIEGRFLKLIVQIIQAKRILEIGTFTGYSALSMAEGLPDTGELITLDIDPDVIAIARKYFERSEHGHKIRIMQGQALETIKKLAGNFDLVFIDADKENYSNYYEAALPLIRSGGVVIIDNVLWGGKVLSPKDASDKAIVAVNDLVSKDNRVDRVLLPIRDGIFLIRKK